MKKQLQQSRQVAQDVDHLLSLMYREIQELRYMLCRYQLMHGEQVETGLVDLKDTTSFYMRTEGGESRVRMINDEDLGIGSNYARILEELKKLDQ